MEVAFIFCPGLYEHTPRQMSIARSSIIRMLGSLKKHHAFDTAVDISGGDLRFGWIAHELSANHRYPQLAITASALRNHWVHHFCDAWFFLADPLLGDWAESRLWFYSVTNISQAASEEICVDLQRFRYFKGAVEIQCGNGIDPFIYLHSQSKLFRIWSSKEAGYWHEFPEDDSGEKRRLLRHLGFAAIRRLDELPSISELFDLTLFLGQRSGRGE